MAMYTVTRVTTLGKGIAMLMNYQIDYIIRKITLQMNLTVDMAKRLDINIQLLISQRIH